MNLLKLFKSFFTQPQEPSPPSVVNYEGVELTPTTPSMSIEEASQHHQCGGWYTQGVKLPEADIEQQINQAAKEMREAQERFHALVAELLSYQSTDAEIVAKTFPQYFKENNHE